ncbi:MAG TPA: glutamate-cysteine ligase family protein [Polyangia bacterium]|jgi:glutamate--cysteine ligase|nr:glutamate-cysteine ligase family protein [Polyangia bacterium]
MTALLGPDKTPITSIQDLTRYFTAGAKPASAWRMGIEQEKIAVLPDGRAVPFVGPDGIEDLLGRLQGTEYEAVREDGHLLALRRGAESVSVEPGGQLEFSGPALPSATECRDSLLAHVALATRVARAMGITFLGVGLRPWGNMEQIPWLPKRRYAVMRDFLPTRGRLGLDMMKRTATVQANVDFDSEENAIDKMRTAAGVTSIVTALYAASPISEGRPNGYASYRAAIWLDTDEARCGLIPGLFQPGFGFAGYVEWALDAPMFFVVRQGAYLPAGGMTFRRFLREGFAGQPATMGDWEVHLSTLFPEVRLKRYIEVRGADAGPMPMALGLGALWRGLLDHAEARRAAWALVASASMDEREALRREVPRSGLRARFVGRPLRDLAVDLLRVARAGLTALPGGEADATLLAPLEARAASGRAPSDDLLDDLQACAGDPRALIKRWELAATS